MKLRPLYHKISLHKSEFTLSPLHLLTILLALMLKKVVLHSVATALANNVFPVPGGPYSNNPFQGERIPEIMELKIKLNPIPIVFTGSNQVPIPG